MKNPEYISRKIMDRYNDRWIRKYDRLYARISQLEGEIHRIKDAFMGETTQPVAELAPTDPPPSTPAKGDGYSIPAKHKGKHPFR